MSTFVIFFRTQTEHDSRRRWHKMSTVRAASRPDALRKMVVPAHDTVIDRHTDTVKGDDGVLYMAEREDRIGSFEHYDFDSTFIPAQEA